jgi:hypothetical protein
LAQTHLLFGYGLLKPLFFYGFQWHFFLNNPISHGIK